MEGGVAGLEMGPRPPPQLPEPFTIERLVPMMDEAGVDRAVIIPPSWPGDRNDYALEAVKRYPTRFRVMGRIPLQDPKSADLIAEMEGAAGNGGNSRDLQQRAENSLARRRHRKLVLGSGRNALAARLLPVDGIRRITTNESSLMVESVGAPELAVSFVTVSPSGKSG